MRLIVIMLVMLVSVDVMAEECNPMVWEAAQTLQPWFTTGVGTARTVRANQLTTLTKAICTATDETGINPLLALAIARRESSLLPLIGLGKRDGARGERGYFQVLPRGPAEKFAPPGCSQHDPECNATTALRYLKHVRTVCGHPDDPWVWIGAYGTSRCPSPTEARTWIGLKVARRFLCDVDKNCDVTWPL